MINDMLIEIINRLSPISMFVFAMTNKNIRQLCKNNKYYQIFKQNTVKISCSQHTMIIKNHHLYSFGSLLNHYTPTIISKGVISVHTGNYHSVFMTRDYVYGIGSNQYGQLGLPLLKNYDMEILPWSPHDILFIYCAENCTFLLTLEGLYGMGMLNGISGISSGIYSKPILISFKDEILQISCGYNHTVVRTKHRFYGYGSNKSNQLGLPYNEVIWDQINTLKVCCGISHTVLLTTDGVYGLGSNISGQLGLGEMNYVNKPTKIELDNVIDICCGYDHTLFLTSHGLYGTGSSHYGELGLGDNKYHHIPIKLNIPFYKYKLTMACGNGYTIITNKKYYGFGDNRHAQLGLGRYKNKKYNKLQLLKLS